MLDLETLRLAIAAALVLAMILLFLALRRLTRHVHSGASGGSTPLWLLALVFFMTIILMLGRPVSGNTYHGYFVLQLAVWPLALTWLSMGLLRLGLGPHPCADPDQRWILLAMRVVVLAFALGFVYLALVPFSHDLAEAVAALEASPREERGVIQALDYKGKAGTSIVVDGERYSMQGRWCARPCVGRSITFLTDPARSYAFDPQAVGLSLYVCILLACAAALHLFSLGFVLYWLLPERLRRRKRRPPRLPPELEARLLRRD